MSEKMSTEWKVTNCKRVPFVENVKVRDAP